MTDPVPTSRTINILLVEDEPLMQFVFKRQMERLGFVVKEIVGNGAAALEKASEGGFDIIFMDVSMPIMDGFDATSKIRKQEAGATRIPIVGLTAYGERQRCLDAGMDDYLRKPVILDELTEVINKWTAASLSKSSDTDGASGASNTNYTTRPYVSPVSLENTNISETDKASKPSKSAKSSKSSKSSKSRKSKIDELRKRHNLDKPESDRE